MKVSGKGVCLAVALAAAGCGQPTRQISPLPSGGPASEQTAAIDAGPRFEPLPDGLYRHGEGREWLTVERVSGE